MMAHPHRMTPRIAARGIAALAAVLALSACGGDDVARTFGLVRDAPDEFQVTTRAPLSMPPNYSLRPPRPGAPRPQEQSTRVAAEAALVPQTALAPAGRDSAGQDALVQAAGPAAPDDIRRKIDADSSLDAPSTSFSDKLLFWRDTPSPGIAVDPRREAQRLRENAAMGQSVQQGDTPIIQEKRGSWLGIF